MVTFPEAKIVTGALAAFRVKVTVTPTGISTVVKLNTPLDGTVSTVFAVGAKAPSAPVLPLSKGADTAKDGHSSPAAKSSTIKNQWHQTLIQDSLYSLCFFIGLSSLFRFT
jgi:hypothetical protein